MRQIPLTQGKVALVDDEDYHFLMQWKWHYTNTGYAARTGKRPKKALILMHRVINKTKRDTMTDHIDMDKLNNSKTNLRSVSGSQNLANSKSRGGSSKYKGVSFNKNRGKWVAAITHKYKNYGLGYHIKEDDAALAYNKKALELFGEHVRLNNV